MKTKIFSIIVPGRDYKQLVSYLNKHRPPDDEALLTRHWATFDSGIYIEASLTDDGKMRWEAHDPDDHIVHVYAGGLSTEFRLGQTNFIVTFKPDMTYE